MMWAVLSRGLVTIALGLCALSAQPQARVEPTHSRPDVPNVTLRDANGHPVSLSAFKGRVVMLDFWETWCGGCKVEIPWYIDFQKKYGARGLRVIGVALDDSGWTTVKPYMRAHPFNYPIVVGDIATIIHAFDLVSLPRTLLIDRHGRIADAHTGIVDRAAWEQEIKALLSEK
jgi:cytochrome c biogenesis protein CcmG/thiol:disulfide interchange protein DsbE